VETDRKNRPDAFSSPTADAKATRDEVKKEFGRRVYTLMLQRGWTQSELAKEAGLTRDAISRYTRHVSIPEPHALLKLANALGVDREALLPDYEGVTKDVASETPLRIEAVRSDPSMAWITINRMVKMSAIPKILAVLEEAENA
jgi:transcriptional regulator with XRE-family HTH domain